MSSTGFWMFEESGVLRPAVEAYLKGEKLTPEHIAALRAYFRQWIAAPWAPSPEIERLRRDVDGLTSRSAISAWFHRAVDVGIDPL